MRAAESRMRELTCAKCGATPGQPCHSKSNRQLSNSHALRWYAAIRTGRVIPGMPPDYWPD